MADVSIGAEVNPLGVVPAPLVIFWTLVGAAVGALVAALVARHQFVAARRDYRLQLRHRDFAVDRLKKELEEYRSSRGRLVEEQERELALVRRERSSLAGDLEESRRTLSTMQSNLETLRISAREAEARLATALDSARQDSAARRATAAEELAAAQQSAHTLRTDLSRRIADLENDRSRLETELAAERRANSERQESLRSIVSTLRAQYSTACTERDAFESEAAAQRARADEMDIALRSMRDEYAERLDSEHHESVELMSKVWDYVHNYPRLRDRPVQGAGGEPFTGGSLPPDFSSASVAHSHPADFAPEPEPEPEPAPGEPRMRSRPHAPPRPVTTDREVPSQTQRVHGDACAGDEYDIERELAEPAPGVEPAPSPEPPPPSASPPSAPSASSPLSQTAAPMWRPVPPPPSGSTRVRKPVAAMRREHDILVICDDGSVWRKLPTGWIEEPPIPGSVVDGEESRTSGGEGGSGRTSVGDAPEDEGEGEGGSARAP